MIEVPFNPTLHETSVEFQYPEDVVAPDLDYLIKQRADDIAYQKLREAIFQIMLLVLSHRNPALKAYSIAKVAGVDLSYVLGCEDTITSIAKKLGVTKQHLQHTLKATADELNIKYEAVKKTNPCVSRKY